MTSFDRRKFLQKSGIGLLPALIPFQALLAAKTSEKRWSPPVTPVIKFYGDGEMYEPGEYLNELQKVHTATNIIKDRYGMGGVVEKLEKNFAEITGKDNAIYMPSGTMANQLAMAVLSGDNTKIFVQDTSHIYRDEADAAQSVFGKRLIPLAKGDTY